MKKLLLTLGATAAIVAPVASVVACGSGNGSGTTPGQGGAPSFTGPSVKPLATLPTVHADTSALATFTESTITEDPYVQGFDMVTPKGTPAVEFKVYDNGLFKIKIATSLIGTNKFFKNEDAAKLEATTVANTINIGPAITHLAKGIQIIDSQNVASLGGNLGVQIAINNNGGSADDEGIINEASLIDHEYGHHETLYDFQSVVGGDINNADNNNANTLQGAMIKGLRGANYGKLAAVEARYNPSIKNDLTFISSRPSDLPSDYALPATQHSVFKATNYPFNPAEMATRVLNVLSCRTDLSPADLYGAGTDGHYEKDGKPTGIGFGLPAAFVSDATMRDHAGDSIFGNGKDASRVKDLINFYMNDIFGLGKAKLHLSGDRNGGKVTGLDMSSFGATDGLENIEIQDSTGTVINTIPVTSFNSRFGFKNELITNKWTTTYNNEVQDATIANLDLDISAGKTYKVVGKDASDKIVDLSKVALSTMSNSGPKGGIWTGFNGIKVDGKNLLISQ